MSVIVHNIPGQKPQVWDRNVVFFANLLSIFFGNREEAQVLVREVGRLESYGGRMVPLLNLIYAGSGENASGTGGGNLLILEKAPQKELIRYFRDDLGLSVPDIEIIPPEFYERLSGDNTENIEFFRMLSSRAAEWVDGYVTDDVLVRIAAKTGKRTASATEGSRRGNNKWLLSQYLKDQGLPVFETYTAADVPQLQAGLKALSSLGYRKAVVKSQVGASGIGMMKVDLDERAFVSAIPGYMLYEGPCLVQGWLDESVEGVGAAVSPSVQMFIRDEDISLHDVTEQILSPDSVHEGNISPPPCLADDAATVAEVLRQAEVVARWLHASGYRGTASADFHVIERNDRREVRVCELNARVTGATYPSVLAGHFRPQTPWLLRNVRFAAALEAREILDILRKKKLLYTPGRDEGVLPFNFNPDDSGRIVKGQFLFMAPAVTGAVSLLKRLSEQPAIKGEFDRD